MSSISSMKILSINNNNIKSNKHHSLKSSQAFKGSYMLDLATKGLQMCDKYPMIGVAVTDSAATDIPRTIFDLVKTGVPAAMETMRREFSGLFVNCLMPSFIVLAVAKLLNKPIIANKYPNVDLSSSWANSESINKFVNTFKESRSVVQSDFGREVTETYFRKLLTGLNGRDGDKWVEFSTKLGPEKMDQVVKILSDAALDESIDKKSLKQLISKASSIITDSTHAGEILSYNIEKGEKFGSNISELLRDSVDIVKNLSKTSKNIDLDTFARRANKLVNAKSLLGLAIILPLAMSVQSINRAITRHKYKQKGAPIYKDFEKGNTFTELNTSQKAKFFSQKLLAAGSMISLALLSMMKKPSLSMFQFKGMFPTVDQCRWIATGTFVSRMFASEDPNELRESTVRDMASFAGLYFLGDYAGKATASIIEKAKPDVKLLNRLGKSDSSSPILHRIGDWIKNTTLKSFDEVLPKDKNMRSICQLASLGFSIISLGVLLPAYNRHVTEKKVALAKKKESQIQNVDSNSKRFIIELKRDKSLAQGGIYEAVAQNCFK